MREFRVRCSSLHRLMTEPRTKAEKEEGGLSVGAKTYVRELAREAIFAVEKDFSSKETEKGTRVEQFGIDLYNAVYFTAHVKNTERREVGGLSGEPDIVAESEGVDIKCPWSIFSFPITLTDADKDEYEWQARGYMKLFDRPRWKIAYCLVDTPDDLIGYDAPEAHIVGHIADHLRVTVWTIERDPALDKRIDEKIAAARLYYAEVIAEFDRLHGGDDEASSLPTGLPWEAPAEPAGANATHQQASRSTAPASLPESIF